MKNREYPLKSTFDRIVAFFCLVIFLPIMLITAILVRIKLGSPVVFKQQRPGYNAKAFTMYKFRTMSNECDKNGMLLPSAERLTKFGIVLRRTSIDELPELINVLKGDMSLVGPRPLLMEYLPLYTAEQSRRHDVKPGITGLAQINGRNTITWESRFKFDTWYVDHCSFILDLKILLLTIASVLQCRNVSQPGEANTDKFTGTSEMTNGG